MNNTDKKYQAKTQKLESAMFAQRRTDSNRAMSLHSGYASQCDQYDLVLPKLVGKSWPIEVATDTVVGDQELRSIVIFVDLFVRINNHFIIHGNFLGGVSRNDG